MNGKGIFILDDNTTVEGDFRDDMKIN